MNACRTRPKRRLAVTEPSRHHESVAHEQVIDRDEVLTIMWALADLRTDVTYLRGIFEDWEDDEEAE